MRRRWRNWCQNEVYKERKKADSRDKVKHNGRSDQLFLEMMMKLYEECMMMNLYAVYEKLNADNARTFGIQ